MSATFLWFLVRLFEEADLVGVFAGVRFDADALEGAEDVVGAEVLLEVFLAVFEIVAVVFEVLFGGVEAFAGVGDLFALVGVAAGVRGEDAIVDEGLAQVTELVVDPATEGGWEVVDERVYFGKLVELGEGVAREYTHRLRCHPHLRRHNCPNQARSLYLPS